MGAILEGISKSPWLYHVNTGSCNGCDIEFVTLITPLYDAERLGVKLAGSPRHADIIVVTGPITTQARERLIRVLEQAPEPKVVLSLGSCPISCNVFKGSYSIDGPLERWTKVDVSVAGCPPKPEAIVEGVKMAVEILKKKREAMLNV